MTKSEFQAYTRGHDAAIFKNEESSNPFKGRLFDAWLEGYKKGKEAVIFHKNSLHSNNGRSSATWLLENSDF